MASLRCLSGLRQSKRKPRFVWMAAGLAWMLAYGVQDWAMALPQRSTITDAASVQTLVQPALRKQSRQVQVEASSDACRGEGDWPRRRSMLPWIGAGLFGCACASCAVSEKARAVTTLVSPSETLQRSHETQRDLTADARVAQGMAYGMRDYERAVFKIKKQLFGELWNRLPRSGSVVVEVGIGSFPNALFLGSAKAPRGIDLIGVDPNDGMERYAREFAERGGFLKPEKGNSLRITHGVAEALPLESGVADAVVCTLTLCSVQDPVQALAEMRRVLRPGGQYLFVEHVLSESDPVTAVAQRLATLEQVKRDGCHFDRRTLETIRAAGFDDVVGAYSDLSGCGFLNPTASGLAVA